MIRISYRRVDRETIRSKPEVNGIKNSGECGKADGSIGAMEGDVQLSVIGIQVIGNRS